MGIQLTSTTCVLKNQLFYQGLNFLAWILGGFLSTPPGVRGAVGLGFVETTGQRTLPVEQLEGRNSNAAYHRGDVGPKCLGKFEKQGGSCWLMLSSILSQFIT